VLEFKGWNLWVLFIDISGKVSRSSFRRSKTGTTYYDPNEMDYSQAYPQHDIAGTAYYNAAPVFLRQPVCLFFAS